jgi:hypothetical protein
MATVYLATDERHERQVAVKVLRPDLAASIGSERFLQEIRIAARLGHPHIVPLLDSGAAGSEGQTLYYVMPYVGGESLRQRLAREGELPIPDAVRIMRDVADALAHAHEHGVVHRDIKPENILLSGRHALVTDFGVAKAVSEATGRNRVTTAGVALGTPAYMAPEQAAADPHVDHRADIYALGVVAYEMVTGQPPFTGSTPQQVLAAHVTETPRPVTTRRPMVPPPVADSIMRCLEKKPADRWQGADALLAQLESAQTSTGGSTPTDTRPYPAARARARRSVLAVAGGAGLVLAAIGVGVWGGRFSTRDAGAAVTLRDRTQLTFTGRIQTPAISPDGKQLAYVVNVCTDTRCSYAVDVQDLGGIGTRRVLEGAASAYFIEWSPDRRHLLVTGTIGRRWGTHLVPLLGGGPRRAGRGGMSAGGGVAFLGGDSLLLMPPRGTDSVHWIRVATLAGVVRDSIRVAAPGSRIGAVAAVPNTTWIVVTVRGASEFEHRVIDRSGNVVGKVAGQPGALLASSDAIWQSTFGGTRRFITRTALNPSTGRPHPHADTVYSGRFTNFSVVADGSALVMDEGAYQHSIYALDMADALAGRFPDTRRLAHGSTPFRAQLSPDGNRLFVRRSLSGSAGTTEFQWTLLPFEGGAESPLPIGGATEHGFFADSVTLALMERDGSRRRFSLLDIRTGASRNELTVPDTTIFDYEPLPEGGWTWIPEGGQVIHVNSAGRVRSIPKPDWYSLVFQLRASAAGRIALIGWDAATEDSVRVSELSLTDGTVTPWATEFADGAGFGVLGDGTIVFLVWEAQEMAVLYHLTAPGQMRRLGAIPRPITTISVSDDLRRVTVGTRDYFGDAWMSRVVRR